MNSEGVKLKKARLLRRMSEEISAIEYATRSIISASDKINMIKGKLEELDQLIGV